MFLCVHCINHLLALSLFLLVVYRAAVFKIQEVGILCMYHDNGLNLSVYPSNYSFVVSFLSAWSFLFWFFVFVGKLDNGGI